MSPSPTPPPDKTEEETPIYTPPSPTLSQPSPSASPASVRAYIASLLTTNRSLPASHAQHIAARWTIGQGRELRAYPAAMYLEIFGREDGWAVCRDVKLRIYEGEAAERREKASTLKARLFVAGVCGGEGAAMPLLVWSLVHERVGLAAFAFVMFVVLSPLFYAIVAAAFEDEPEEKVERELREGVKTAMGASSGA
ncbi:hypothetical protein WHR41_03744 [Cladosporium halotolerans]|uniref:Uncharacterized protein n=1 Tax=Cladosporium halotolerans TaxID=1052096 RepID=A0AB34KQP6_9PEZI